MSLKPACRPQHRVRVWPPSHRLFPPSTKEFPAQLDDEHFADIGRKVMEFNQVRKHMEDFFRVMANEDLYVDKSEKKNQETWQKLMTPFFLFLSSSTILPYRPDGLSNKIWRPVFQHVVGRDLQKKTIDGILASVDLHYPEFAPWQPINYELDENQKWVHRNFLQITTTNFRQPRAF